MADANRASIYLNASLAALPLLALWFWRQRRLSVAMPSKTVVVVGASWAGINVAHGLLKEVPDAKVVLVNPSDEFFFNIASPRVIAKPGDIAREKYLYQIVSLFEKYPNRKNAFDFVLGKAVSIDLEGKKVSVAENATTTDLAYDYLVIASGSTSNATTGTASLKVPFKAAQEGGQLESEIKAAQEAIKSAKSIIIGGAGAVGVEFAGEITDAYPDTKVTLVTNTDSVLPILKASPRQKAAKILKSKGVEVLTGKTVQAAELDAATNKWTVTLADGEVLSADAYISTTGSVPNNDFIPASLLNESGWVEVDAHFKVASTDSVYAVGDITHYSARLTSRIAGQVSVLVSNLKADITGKGKRAAYDSNQTLMMLVPIGKSSGTGQIGGFTAPGFMVLLVKGRDYFTGSGMKFVAG
ncbi:hypothetical protein UA08_00568 [Talaromyces atroroseus]|uniref:FAD/NAD(P)-binding domain-containing protein n=1 Tax=Talaromyces atroroseus TaxID=1441469 RepID=A0A225B1M5_TALAT|nr:hypothetical protein UA08_00568 [Talaromyces atroroseus]OKL64614.1 hypothetical protein UA08_00568 [Talaromyces atroroseus]